MITAEIKSERKILNKQLEKLCNEFIEKHDVDIVFVHIVSLFPTGVEVRVELQSRKPVENPFQPEQPKTNLTYDHKKN